MAVFPYEREPLDDVIKCASLGDVVDKHCPDRSSEKRLRKGLEGKFPRSIPDLLQQPKSTLSRHKSEQDFYVSLFYGTVITDRVWGSIAPPPPSHKIV